MRKQYTSKEESKHNIETSYKQLRFFKIPINLDENNIYQKMLKHQSLPYSNRILKEIAWGTAIAVAELPLSITISHYMVESKFLSNRLSEDKILRMNARFTFPIAEELIFRGALLYGLDAGAKKLGMKDTHAALSSSILNSLLFSATHYKGMRLNSFVGGMIYSAMTYYFNGSLVPAITSHIVNNNIALTGRTSEALVTRAFKRR
jgi:hypothetical protein